MKPKDDLYAAAFDGNIDKQIQLITTIDYEYEDLVGHQGKNRYILMVMGRQLEARHVSHGDRYLGCITSGRFFC